MPRIQYKKCRPGDERLQLIQQADAILGEYAEQGFDLTVRQLFYQFVARDLFPDSWIDEEYNAKNGLALDTKNTQKNYKRVSDFVAVARDGGLLDWDHVKDRGRRVLRFTHYRDPSQFIKRVSKQFALDMWKDQPKRVECWVEKDALSQVLESACDPFDVPVLATKGYASASTVWDAAHNRFMKWAQDGQEIVVLHLADHDPSGVNMTKDLRQRLGLYSSCYRDTQRETSITVRRIAMNMDWIIENDPPPNPAKETDPRAKDYKEEFGDNSWELDAIDPPQLVEIIQTAIREELDSAQYASDRERERQGQAQLDAVRSHWSEIVDFMRDEEFYDADEHEDD